MNEALGPDGWPAQLTRVGRARRAWWNFRMSKAWTILDTILAVAIGLAFAAFSLFAAYTFFTLAWPSADTVGSQVYCLFITALISTPAIILISVWRNA